MDRPVPAVDYLASPAKYPPRPVCAVFGAEGFLRRESLVALRQAVLDEDEGEFGLTTFDGAETDLRDVLDELRTLSMFGGGRRLVVVEGADRRMRRALPAQGEEAAQEEDEGEGEESSDSKASERDSKQGGFVRRYRQSLEEYVAHPSPHGVLVLECGSLPSNWRLHKVIVADGLAIECSAPSGAKLLDWVVRWTAQRHATTIARPAAELLVEMAGTELGLLDQELAKLAVTVGSKGQITAEIVSQSVGAWRVRTAWDMLDSALAGNAGAALAQLDRLLAAGEPRTAVLAQVAATLRRMAGATRVVLRDEATGKRMNLPAALKYAGFPSYPSLMQKGERQLRHLGRERGMRLYRWLLEADLDLKGASQLDGRTVLERLLIRVATPRETHV